MKILTVIGARPQFIKAAAVSRAIEEHNRKGMQPSISEVIVHTGQHYDHNMSDIFFEEMKIPRPNYSLGIGAASHGAMTGRMLEKIEEVLVQEKPDVVLVYGDTNSTLAGALAASKLSFPVAHVEAGLRSMNFRMPEEQNRILVDRISTWLFCPTDHAIQNLNNEGFSNFIGKQSNSPKVVNTGDVMCDAVRYYILHAKPSEKIHALIDNHKCFYLSTIHRAENTDDRNRLESIIKALDEIAADISVVLPLHPRTRNLLDEYGLFPKQIEIIEPVGYFDMLTLLSRCKAVFTDSGGLQKESYFLHKPCVTLRDETEWVELVTHGYNVLCGADKHRIIEAEKGFINSSIDWNSQLYGEGHAAAKIINEVIRGYLS
ncbi:UDP-N-acetyl glucosamine 2-epimerase [Anaerosporomusa subterranea]|uniref:UDP-N-acetyl glucosamine 2-epimerase n=1 Tax=Anaerosporomusa subterranea TaxID=1794912 RepID=A0A154BRD9_ANASB|nr:UDP-N-acetylglucosamine 2-epimerase (non-hydrolyzing) [Anaerosporomusa subterranea]KYZ76425.1 UDP-N-acetyl glucosamine 2-epimerase [Anaerosporomusa subterranea]